MYVCRCAGNSVCPCRCYHVCMSVCMFLCVSVCHFRCLSCMHPRRSELRVDLSDGVFGCRCPSISLCLFIHLSVRACRPPSTSGSRHQPRACARLLSPPVPCLHPTTLANTTEMLDRHLWDLCNPYLLKSGPLPLPSYEGPWAWDQALAG